MSPRSQLRRKVLAGALALAFAGEASATLITVTSPADSGAGTLRAALQFVQTESACGCIGNPYTINFAFSGLTTIPVNSTLPSSTCQTYIDGYDQTPVPATGATFNSIADIRSGTNAQLKIVLDGSVMTGGPGLVIGGPSSVVQGLAFRNFPGVALDIQSGASFVAGNHFGVNESATACTPRAGMVGVSVGFSASATSIGGNSGNPADRNVFGCNVSGIVVSGNDAGIYNNLIGSGAGGAALPNGTGISIPNSGFGPGIDIGDVTAGLGNLISQNTGAGVAVGANRNSVYIQGNDIFLNGGLGIDLAPNANNNQNFPLIDFVRYDGTATSVDWTLSGFANSSVSIGFHANPPGLGLDEGARWIGFENASTDGAGLASGTFFVSGTQPSPTAVATSSAGTSEFSPPASMDVSPKFLTFPPTVVGGSSAQQTVTFTNISSSPITIGPPLTMGDFAATATGCDGITSIPPSGTCTVNVTYNPIFVGFNFDYLDVATSGTGGGRGIGLSGDGVVNPILTATPAGPVNFGSSLVGTPSASVTITISNTGVGTFDIAPTGVSITGAAASSFVIVTDTCSNATVGVPVLPPIAPPDVPGNLLAKAGAPVTTCTVTLGMTPQAVGALAAGLQIVSNATNPTVTIALTGTGIAPPTPVLAATPAGPINFGALQVGSTSTPVTVTYANSGTGSLTIANAALAGTTPGSFQIVTNTCNGATLTASPATTCTIAVAMQPQSSGPLSADLQVSSNATNPNLAVALVGTGSTGPLPRPTLTVVPTGPVDFGPRRIGTQSPPTTFTVTASGVGSATISDVSVRAAGFVKSADTCTGATLGTTAPSCTLAIAFLPTETGVYRVNLQILSSANNPQVVVELTGTGTPPPAGILSANPGAVGFGTQPIGVATNAQTVLVTNTGNLPVAVSAVRTGGDFKQTNDCRALDPSQSCRVIVTFRPTAQGDRSGNLVLESDASNTPLVVSLQGAGSPAPIPVVELNPGAVSFGTSLMGSGGGTTPITLRNAGGASLTLSRIFTVGDFRLTHNCLPSLPPSASCLLNVTFVPSITGPRTGKVVVESNAPDGNKEAPLSGTGCRSFGLGPSRLAQPVCK
jgi:hypothetical protein